MPLADTPLVGVVIPISAVQEGYREDLVVGKMNSE
jgi:hypothetical protein